VLRGHGVWLPVDFGVVPVHVRELVQGTHHRVADQVRERNFPTAAALQVVVDDDAVVGHQFRGDRAHTGRRGQAQWGVHVLGDGGSGSAEPFLFLAGVLFLALLLGGLRRFLVLSGLTVACCGLFLRRWFRRSGLWCHSIGLLLFGRRNLLAPLRLPRLLRLCCRGPIDRGVRSVCGAVLLGLPALRGLLGLLLGGFEIGEEIVPRGVYRGGVGEVLLVHLLDKPLVVTELRRSAAGHGRLTPLSVLSVHGLVSAYQANAHPAQLCGNPDKPLCTRSAQCATAWCLRSVGTTLDVDCATP